jgi:hypothetical protein
VPVGNCSISQYSADGCCSAYHSMCTYCGTQYFSIYGTDPAARCAGGCPPNYGVIEAISPTNSFPCNICVGEFLLALVILI